jgi:hypothetical protein
LVRDVFFATNLFYTSNFYDEVKIEIEAGSKIKLEEIMESSGWDDVRKKFKPPWYYLLSLNQHQLLIEPEKIKISILSEIFTITIS